MPARGDLVRRHLEKDTMSVRTDPILVTGTAGFIGHATAHRLLDRGERVIGVDIVNDYYDQIGRAHV